EQPADGGGLEVLTARRMNPGWPLRRYIRPHPPTISLSNSNSIEVRHLPDRLQSAPPPATPSPLEPSARPRSRLVSRWHIGQLLSLPMAHRLHSARTAAIRMWRTGSVRHLADSSAGLRGPPGTYFGTRGATQSAWGDASGGAGGTQAGRSAGGSFLG